jgi:hypothetical protein
MPRKLTFADVVPGAVYTAEEVAGLFRRSVETVERWVRRGELAPLPRPTGRGPYSFLGSVLLARLGQSLQALPPPSETVAERARRVAALDEESRRLAKGPADRPTTGGSRP